MGGCPKCVSEPIRIIRILYRPLRPSSREMEENFPIFFWLSFSTTLLPLFSFTRFILSNETDWTVGCWREMEWRLSGSVNITSFRFANVPAFYESAVCIYAFAHKLCFISVRARTPAPTCACVCVYVPVVIALIWDPGSRFYVSATAGPWVRLMCRNFHYDHRHLAIFYDLSAVISLRVG